MLSILVNFYNNRREAMNTLHSMTRAYQGRGGGAIDLPYEVVAIDNGSREPLREADVRAFGPEFHYRYVDTASKSPAVAINAAVRECRGDRVMVVIDGAHILTPGILGLSDLAFRTFRSPFVATCGLHLGPKLQNASVAEGYDREAEERILARSGWKESGYRLFYASRAFADASNAWFGQLFESSCFAMAKTEFLALGGFDERFQSPGGGLVNLDLFARATATAMDYVVLLGEATFHQVHGGVGTNAPVEDHPFQAFNEEYHRIRGKPFAPASARPFFMGRIGNEALAASRASANAGLLEWERRHPIPVDVFR